MSDGLTPEAPETSEAVTTPPDVEAAEGGSAGAAGTNMVEAERFNGLMSAHQRALRSLEEERNARIALETQLQEEKNTVTDTASDEVALLRQELAAQRLETAKANALARYPDAVPFADLIQGSNADEIEAVAAAIATRMAAVKENLVPTPEGEVTEDTEPEGEVAPTTAPVVAAPVVVAGGTTPPGEPTSRDELLQEAIANKDWGAFWAAKTGPADAHNLA